MKQPWCMFGWRAKTPTECFLRTVGLLDSRPWVLLSASCVLGPELNCEDRGREAKWALLLNFPRVELSPFFDWGSYWSEPPREPVFQSLCPKERCRGQVLNDLEHPSKHTYINHTHLHNSPFFLLPEPTGKCFICSSWEHFYFTRQ